MPQWIKQAILWSSAAVSLIGMSLAVVGMIFAEYALLFCYPLFPFAKVVAFGLSALLCGFGTVWIISKFDRAQT